MRRPILLFGSLLLAAVTAVAASIAPYRIALRNGRQLLSKDRPVLSGSVLLFHQYPRGALTGVPFETVASINVTRVANAAPAERIKVLNPGDLIILGPTGEGQASQATAAILTAPAPGSATIPGGVYDPRMPIYGGSYVLPNPAGNAQTIAPSGDLARAQSGPPPTESSPFPIGPNGYPVNPNAPPPVIGPNGQPVMNPGAAGSAPPNGPNGTPILAPAGAPGSTPPPIGPNGYPVLTNPTESSASPNPNPSAANASSRRPSPARRGSRR